MSPQRLINALNSAKANEISNGYYRVQANDDMKIINETLKIDWSLAYRKSEDIKNYANGWCTTE